MAEQTSPLNQYIGNYVNQMYMWNNNAPFYALATPYLVQYYQQQVRLWDWWNTGYVPGFHSEVLGLLPSGKARSICHKVAELINGEGVIYTSKDKKLLENPALDFISNEFEPRVGLRSKYKDAILKAATLGNSLLKVNADEKMDLWVDVIAGNRFFVDLDSRGDISSARIYVNVFTTGVQQVGGNTKSYGLMEERYWKDVEEEIDGFGNTEIVRRPVVCYRIYDMSGVANVFTPNASNTSIPYKDLPRKVQNDFRAAYGDVMLGEEQTLPLIDLGVYLCKHTEYVDVMPNIKLGESCLSSILNFLMKYDTIFSEEYNELYLSRAKVIVPQYMAKGSTNKIGSGFDGFTFTKVPAMSDKDQTPIAFMPKMRTADFVKSKEDCCKEIANNLGYSVTSLFDGISDNRGVITAREISSEESTTTLVVNNKREILRKPFNDLMRCITRFYAFLDEVEVDWLPAGATNRTQTIENVTKLKSVGLISDEQAMKELYPTDNEKQIENKVEQLVSDNAWQGSERP